jgi:F-type H+-transporting ATPase subunit b
VKRALFVRRAAMAAMAIVTAWSIWAVAETRPARPHEERHGETDKGNVRASDSPWEPTAEGEGSEEGGPPPIHWMQYGAMLVNFGILAGAYYLLGKKPIAAALVARRDSIAKEIDEAQRMKREAEERAKTYQAKLERLEEEVRMAREALVRAAEGERERIVAEAEAKAARMHKDAEFLALQELKQVRQELLRETVEAAVLAAQELLKSGITIADQERLAEEYLATLGTQKAQPPPESDAREATP